MPLYLGSKMVSALSGAAKAESPVDLETLIAVCDAINGEAVDGEPVEEKVMRLMQTKEDIKAALKEQGQTVTDADAFSSYADKVRAIEGGGGTIDSALSVTFMSEDGTTKLGERAVLSGNTCGSISAPEKESTASQNFTFTGWSRTLGGAADSSALVNVTEDRTVYAVFAASAREYTVRFYDGTTLLHTTTVAYGGTASFADPEKDGYYFDGWMPSNKNITADTDCIAQWSEALTFANGTWEKISEVCEAGQAADYFAVGDEKTIYTETYGNIVLRIIGINFDNKADGSGKAGITVAATKPGSVAIHSGIFSTNNYASWSESTYTSGGSGTIMRWCRDTFKKNLPTDLQSVIKTVAKKTTWKSPTSNTAIFLEDTSDTVFVPSRPELGVNAFTGALDEGLGAYPGLTESVNQTLYDGSGNHVGWWTRTAYNAYAYTVRTGQVAKSGTSYMYPCFCI